MQQNSQRKEKQKRLLHVHTDILLYFIIEKHIVFYCILQCTVAVCNSIKMY